LVNARELDVFEALACAEHGGGTTVQLLRARIWLSAQRRIGRASGCLRFPASHAAIRYCALPAPTISEGTFMLLDLLTALCGPDCPDSRNMGCSHVVLIDDIDQWLYPRVQAGLIKLWQAAFEVDHGLQIITKKLMLCMTRR
jgi:hypothetical protein